MFKIIAQGPANFNQRVTGVGPYPLLALEDCFKQIGSKITIEQRQKLRDQISFPFEEGRSYVTIDY